jgi:hypothetical protein
VYWRTFNFCSALLQLHRTLDQEVKFNPLKYKIPAKPPNPELQARHRAAAQEFDDMWRTGDPAPAQQILADAVSIVSMSQLIKLCAPSCAYCCSVHSCPPRSLTCRRPDRLAGSAQYDPVLGHEKHGRKSFEEMIQTFSQVSSMLCQSMHLCTIHSHSGICWSEGQLDVT